MPQILRNIFIICYNLLMPAYVYSGDKVHFGREVRPILANKCFKCHGQDQRLGALDLQTFATATRRLPSGARAIVPGQIDQSELIRRILAHERSDRMPQKSEALAAQQIDTLRRWIEQGATYEEHWAFIKPEKKPIPQVKARDWPRNPIDYYVLARLEAEQLTPMKSAEKAQLLRRACLDITGLPPSPDELKAFLQDSSEQAYEKALDRLLASPHYGEHMARWWLDLARYADTNGYEKDNRRSLWPYRDWVINAFNADMPFNEFTLQQLAGDLLPNAEISQKIATGFHRNTMVNTEGGTDDEEFRVAAVVDRVNTTMSVWMGITFNCCQCHNHKFDPFTTKEYYQIYAFLNNTSDGGRSTAPEISVPTQEETNRKNAIHRKMIAQSLTLLANPPWNQAILLQNSIQRIQSLNKLLGGIKPATTMVMQELARPRPTHIQIRGNFKNLGDLVEPATPKRLHPLVVRGRRLPNRTDLAHWLVTPANPLVGRVTMNRLWARLFGKGIVETSEDFGTQGEWPTHPELLDYLAVDFAEQGWSFKKILKSILSSATYRQIAIASPQALAKDPYNILFSRGPRFRLDAETIRDNALAISGLLHRKIGGPSVFPYQPEGVWANPYSGDRWTLSDQGDQYRRGIYTFWRRTAPYATFLAFDAPSREVLCERRTRSNTPLQALATLNDHAFFECAQSLARIMLAEPGSTEDRLQIGFTRSVARSPTKSELQVLLHLLQETRARYEKNPAAARKLCTAPTEHPVELASWIIIANVLLNMDETLTKS